MPGDLHIILHIPKFVKYFFKKDQEFFRNFHSTFFIGDGGFDAPLPTIATVFEWVVVGADPYNADRYAAPKEVKRVSPIVFGNNKKGASLRTRPSNSIEYLDYTSSMTAISAASPRRAPVRVTLV